MTENRTTDSTYALIERLYQAVEQSDKGCDYKLHRAMEEAEEWLRVHPADWEPPAEGLPNLWLGVSVENRTHLDRLTWLKQTPAAVRFASFEPLLEDLGDIRPYLLDTTLGHCSGCRDPNNRGATHSDGTIEHPVLGIDWAIIGGESGPGARVGNIEWHRNIIRQCDPLGIAVFEKQLGKRIYACAPEGFPRPQGRRPVRVARRPATAGVSKGGKTMSEQPSVFVVEMRGGHDKEWEFWLSFRNEQAAEDGRRRQEAEFALEFRVRRYVRVEEE